MKRMLSMCLLATILLSGFAARSNQVVYARESSVPVAKPDVLDCNTSPFGRVLTIGGENEMFVSFRGGFGSASANDLQLDRLDVAANDTLTLQNGWVGTAAPYLDVFYPAITTADFAGNGDSEVVQAFLSGTSSTLVASDSVPSQKIWQHPITSLSDFAIAGGSLAGDDTSEHEVAVAARTSGGSMSMTFVNGTGADQIADTQSYMGYWRSKIGNRLNPQLISTAMADMDGDGRKEVVAAFREDQTNTIQLIVFRYVVGHTDDGGANYYESNIDDIATLRISEQNPKTLRLIAGNFDGGFTEEIALLNDREPVDAQGTADQIMIRTFSLNSVTNTLVQENSLPVFIKGAAGFAAAAGDTDADGLDEVVLGYSNYDVASSLVVRSFNAEFATISPQNTWNNNLNNRSTAKSLALAVGDTDKNGSEEIIAAFNDAGNQLQVIRLQDGNVGGTGMTLKGERRDGTNGRTNATNISLALGDWDNDSLRASYAPATGSSLQCKEVVQQEVTAYVGAPPYWKNIQQNAASASIGESTSTSQTDESAYAFSTSHSVTGYIGAGVDGVVASASLKVTAGYEYQASQRRSSGTTKGETLYEGWTNANNFVVLQKTRSNCYSYQLQQSSTPIDGAAHFCEYKDLTEEGPNIDSWDRDEGLLQPDSKTWFSVAPDWSNLALFRGANTVQSSSVAPASRAVDGNTDGTAAKNSLSTTTNELNPWWQIDLGSSQDISKVRVWSRTDRRCGNALCADVLQNYDVFVSDTDFRTISNDPAVLRTDSRVKAYKWNDIANNVTTFLTLQNNFQLAKGRYVRVQRSGTAQLSLAEVQVFGANHVEPDRYPADVRDVTPNDGSFEVKLYNPVANTYEWVQMRGNLVWNGAAQGVLSNVVVGPGEGVPSWSRSQETSTFNSNSNSVENTARIGVEFDVEAGLFGKVQAGGGYEFSASVLEESIRSLQWGTSFELGGGVGGFPTQINGQPVVWPARCKYGFQPFVYETTDESNYGFQQRYLALDYIVPEARLNRGTDLSACRNGTFQTGLNNAPTAVADLAVTYKNNPVVIDVVANDTDANNDQLSLTAVGTSSNGTVSIQNGKVTFTPNTDFVGTTTFSYTVSDGIADTQGLVTVKVVANRVLLPMVLR